MDWRKCDLPEAFGLDGFAFRSGSTVVATKQSGERLHWQLFWKQPDGTLRPGNRGAFFSEPEKFTRDAVIEHLYAA
jgi:hypothetical protein